MALKEQQINTKKDFLEIFNQYSDAIFRFGYFQTRNRSKALSLTEDTFLRGYEYLTTGKKILSVRPFVYRIIGNLVERYHRYTHAQAPDTSADETLDIPEESQHSPHSIKEVAEQLALVDEKYRDVIIMQYIEEMPLSEIMEVTGETESNVYVRENRGMEDIKESVAQVKEKLTDDEILLSLREGAQLTMTPDEKAIVRYKIGLYIDAHPLSNASEKSIQ